MTALGNGAPSGSLALPAYSLDVQALDLGPGVPAVGMELLGTESREPVKGLAAAEIWTATLLALAAKDFFVVDFFSHVERVTEFCTTHGIVLRHAAERCLVVAQPKKEQLQELFERFEAETFGWRAGTAAQRPDTGLETELSKRGLDAYQPAYAQYTFCAIFQPEDGWVTLLSEKFHAGEVIRRARPAVEPFDVFITQPN
ncbi:MAG: hypothetical protein NVS9B4_10740 [Candidatus Acidiferrum sp.]